MIHGIECCSKVEWNEYYSLSTIKRLDDVVMNTDKSNLGAMMWAICTLEWVEKFVFVNVAPKVSRDMPLEQLRNKAEVLNWAVVLNVICGLTSLLQ